MELTGSVAGMLKLLGGGSDVEITQLLSEGTAIAIVKVDENTITLYAPEGGGSDVEVTPALLSGTKIADIKIDDDTTALYAPTPTSVNVNQVLTEGTKIAEIGVNGVTTDIYAPGSGDSYSNDEHIVGKWFNKTLYERTIDVSFASVTQIDNTFYYCGVDISQILPNITQAWIVNDMSYFTEPNEPNIVRKFIYACVSSPNIMELWTAYSRTGTATITFRYTKD